MLVGIIGILFVKDRFNPCLLVLDRTRVAAGS